ncbi:hypothetical protein FA15DRAFT_670013 [Coprinopsis marcescibilis]|uniref:Protein kinase domain-containing protein n=1 Tax=Coprinopsis marcescibilis TaxID=230819 RepID=A0A5C3KTZ2_COPMA|nr:hypothetical protein FA15DRAFT_670013 [Coprinopsis marcescibilis]
MGGYDSPMLTPSPLRQPAIFSPKFANNQDHDDHFLHSPYSSPAQAQLFKSPSYTTKPQPIRADDEEGLIFLSANPSTSFTSLFHSSTSPRPLASFRRPQAPTGRVPLSVRDVNEQQTVPAANDPATSTRVGIGTKRKSTPQCTPLKVDTSGPFERLAPLCAPRFALQTPQSKADADAFISKNTATLTKLKLCDRADRMDTSTDSDHDSDCEFGNRVGASLFNKGAAKGKDKEEIAEAISPGGHIVKRRARARPLSAELREQALRSPSPAKKSNLGKPRSRLSGTVAFPSSTAYRSRTSPGSSSSEGGSPLPRRRINNGPVRPHIKPPIFPTRPPLTRADNLSAATLFFGPTIPQTNISPARSRTNTTLGTPECPLPRPRHNPVNRHSYAGTGTSGDWSFMASAHSPSQWSTSKDGDGDISTDLDEDMSFEGPARSSFTFSLTSGTPSPSSKRPLPRKYEAGKAGSVLVDNDNPGFFPPRHSLTVMPGASTSVSSFGSDDGLITPLTGPSSHSSGWPGPQVQIKDTDDHRAMFTDDESDVDEFIVRTLAAAAKGPAPGGKRVPGTPVKKSRTTFLGGDRPWQSAVTSKIGLKEDIEPRKMPRKSLPAAFPSAGSRGGRSLLDQCTDTEDEEESPSAKKDARYTKLGLGHPGALFGGNGPLAMPRSRWLMRRSSSGAFSSGSESTSQANTPTRSRGIDWQLPKLLSPSGSGSKASDRSASGSSTSSGATSSPTNRKTVQAGLSARRRRLSEPFSEEKGGRFEREFVTVDEVGSGEFGSVIKVRRKNGDDNEVYAIKKSKRFEGVKHRLRLWEEVDILKHLSAAAVESGLSGQHPNVLAYIDSWEEGEALYIQTELCESGSLARFLWEYGKMFPRLDEARVWKSVVDLSNGLCFIHDAGVIHLDLKPSNVFVTQEGRFTIGDFGMASLWPRKGGAETDGTSFEREGDKLYLAPEVLQGRYGKAADVFSLGMTILETATNILVPDQGESWHRLRREDFSEIDWAGSEELFELIKATMRTEPEERMSAREVYEHKIVGRARRKMEEIYEEMRASGESVFAASPLARVPRGFLEELLSN